MSFEGEIFRRHDQGYAGALESAVRNERKPDRRPDMIVYPRDDEDVAEAVRLARREGMKVSARGGGHSFNATHVREGMLIDFRRMRETSIDVAARTATVTPSVTSREFAEELATHGLTFPSGHCSTVGLGGFLLQGGFGWNGRTHGPACASVTAIDVVTADGELVRSDNETNPELIWAARGSGAGFFGIVTRFHLRVFPIARAIHDSTYGYPLELREEVLSWLIEIAPEMPPELEVIAHVMAPRADGSTEPGIPPLAVRGVAHVDTAAEAEALLGMLDTCPVLDRATLRETCVPTDISGLYDKGDPLVSEERYAVDCMWTDASAERLLPELDATLTSVPTPQTHIDILFWREQEVSDGVFSMQAPIFISLYTQWQDRSDDALGINWAADQMRRLEPLSRGIQLADDNLSERAWPFLAEERLARLEQLRGKYDPDGVFPSYLLEPGVRIEGGKLVR